MKLIIQYIDILSKNKINIIDSNMNKKLFAFIICITIIIIFII